jgi:hypothetical protein
MSDWLRAAKVPTQLRGWQLVQRAFRIWDQFLCGQKNKMELDYVSLGLAVSQGHYMPVSRAVRAFLAIAVCLPVLGRAASQYFVSPEGDDAWTGLQPEPAFLGKAGPFRTLGRARQAIVELKAKGLLVGEVRVVLAEGDYRFPHGLALGPRDFGGFRTSIVYLAAPEAKVVFRGDMPLTGWQREAGGRFRAAVPAGSALALYGHDEPLIRARYPNWDAAHPRSGGFCYVSAAEPAAGTLFLRLTGTHDLAANSWAQLTKATLHIWPDHAPRKRLAITAANASSRSICIAQERGIVAGTRLFFEGIPSELDAPGEWLADATGCTVRVIPPANCDPETGITASTAPCLLTVTGGGPGELRFEGIEFRGSAGDLVRVREAKCVFERCVFRLCEGDGITVEKSPGVRVEGCDFRQVGGTAIRFSASPRAVVRNCWIAETGARQPTEAAIVLADDACSQATIANNLLHDLPGSGIVLRGSGHRCERNLLHHLGQEDSDGAGIVATGGTTEQPTVILDNVVMDPGGYRRRSATEYAFPSGMAGIAVLDGSGTRVADNLLVRGSLAGVHVSGRAHVIENNLLVGGGRAHIDLGSAAELTVRRNVVLNLGEDTAWLAGDRLLERVQHVDWNMLWGYPDDPILRSGDRSPTWNEWQQHGFDRRSVLADPLFRAPQLDEYELLPESLALKLGFVPLAPEKAGCFADPARRTWPIDDHVWQETHILGVPRFSLSSGPAPPSR